MEIVSCDLGTCVFLGATLSIVFLFDAIEISARFYRSKILQIMQYFPPFYGFG